MKVKDRKVVQVTVGDMVPHPIALQVKCPVCQKMNLIAIAWRLEGVAFEACNHLLRNEDGGVDVSEVIGEEGEVYAEIAFDEEVR